MQHGILTLHDPKAAHEYYARGLWRAETYYQLLLRQASERPDRYALRDGRCRLTWRELLESVDAYAAALGGRKIKRGQRVAIWAPNRIEAVLVYLACARNGHVCMPALHIGHRATEVARLAAQFDIVAVIMIQDGTPEMSAFSATEAFQNLPAAWAIPRERTSRSLPGDTAEATVEECADSICYLGLTSGTTGNPKGVLHSHNTLLANARDLARDWDRSEDTVLLCLIPTSHHVAWLALAQCLICGGELVLNDPPASFSTLDWLIESKADYVMGVPTHGIDILSLLERSGLTRLGAVRTFYLAGAPIPPSLAERLIVLGIKPQNVYGMTENSSHQYTHPQDDADTIVSSCGRGGSAYEVCIFDQNEPNAPLPAGQVGQIGGRGASLMLGYFGDQKETERSFNDNGWFLSGDLGSLDDRGALRVVGRLKDVIIRGGKNIYPARIEDIALKHESVLKAAAFPVPDERLGEKVCLAVLPRTDCAVEAKTLLRHLHDGGLAKEELPEYFACLDNLPLTPSGKIMKRKLVDDLNAGVFKIEACRFSEAS